MELTLVTYRGTVYPWQCDHMGHMNVMWYVGKFDEATWQLLASFDVSGMRMQSEGFGMVAVNQHVEYLRELRAGDVVTVRSGIREVGEKSVHFAHEMTNDLTNELAARTVLTGICIDTAARKARRLPDDVRSAMMQSTGSAGRETST
jgi:acyl-CoA thioester hydrolase